MASASQMHSHPGQPESVLYLLGMRYLGIDGRVSAGEGAGVTAARSEKRSSSAECAL